MRIHESFPRYEQFDPLVPVCCITPNDRGCMHRFFDSSPISPSGRYAAVFQLPFEDRQPEPGEKGNVRLVDFETGENRVLAETCGWEPQLGANINWGASDNELFYNDVDTKTWQPFAWKLDPLSGRKEKLEGTVYQASLDGKWLISANLALMRKTQNGYGVAVPQHAIRRYIGLVEDDGLYLTDTSTGRRRMRASIRDLIIKADPPILQDAMENCEFYGFHSRFNRQSTRIMMSLRWFRERGPDVRDIVWNNHSEVRYALVTMPLEGNSIHCAIGPDQFLKGGHHAAWLPDGEHISMNLKLDGKHMRFIKVRYNGKDLREIVAGVRGSGHPTVHPSGHILTDTYLQNWDFPQYGDGTVPLRWVDMKTGGECVAIRMHVQQPCDDVALRVDPHPAWDRTWRYITFNGYEGGTRRVFLADMDPLLSGAIKPAMFRVAGCKPSIIRRGGSFVKRILSRAAHFLNLEGA